MLTYIQLAYLICTQMYLHRPQHNRYASSCPSHYALCQGSGDDQIPAELQALREGVATRRSRQRGPSAYVPESSGDILLICHDHLLLICHDHLLLITYMGLTHDHLYSWVGLSPSSCSSSSKVGRCASDACLPCYHNRTSRVSLLRILQRCLN